MISNSRKLMDALLKLVGRAQLSGSAGELALGRECVRFLLRTMDYLRAHPGGCP